MSNVTFTKNNLDDMPAEEPLDEKRWETLDDFIDDPDFEEVMIEKFPREAAVLQRSGMDRRQFMKVMGGSMVMGGLVLTGCGPARPDQENIIPYVRMPEEIIAGRPLFFATTYTQGGYGIGAVLETHEARPHRIEGNPNHPASMGGANSQLLATVLEIYSPNRSSQVLNQGNVSTRQEFELALTSVIPNLGSGSGLAFLTELTSSPSFASEIDLLKETYPDAQWYQYEASARTNVNAGSELAFGEVVNTVYQFENAEVILSLDSDFLIEMPGSLAYAKAFAAARRVKSGDTEQNRLYAVSSTPSNTSSVADHVQSMRASDVEAFTLALARALGVDGGAGAFSEESAAFGEAVVANLQEAGSNAVVVAGDAQSPAVHALAHAINASLGAVGSTLYYTDSPLTSTDNVNTQLDDLTSAMGGLDALIIIGGNPAYASPSDSAFASSLNAVDFSVHLSLYNNETSQACTWHVPTAYFIETWGDSLAFDGTASIQQPPTGALYEAAMEPLELVALIAGDERSPYEIVRDYWQENSGASDFNMWWRQSLHDGVIADSAFESTSPSLSLDLGTAVTSAGEGLEVIVRLDAKMGDGRFANNPWLHELPHPLTKVSWDMVAMMSENTADELNLDDGDLITIEVEGRSMQAPAYAMARHADNSITVSLGYGTGMCEGLEAGYNFNAYQLLTSDANVFTGATVTREGGSYPIAVVQKNMDPFDTKPARSTTLSDFIADPDNIQVDVYDGNIYANTAINYTGENPGAEIDYTDQNQWGMSIDLTSCIGCNACIVGCQSENNIPTVGKDEVLQERDMHWLRVDIYHIDEGNYSQFQPVPCMHCENAPCEQVCPVQATVHDHEGLNQMVYNRCVGTRYCSANCPYGVRRFNYLDYTEDTGLIVEQRNPDVSVRLRGVMEKCTYCWQRINTARVASSVEDRPIADGEVTPACATACPTDAIIFGNLNDSSARVVAEKAQPHSYSLLDDELNTKPRTTYLAKVWNPNDALYEQDADAESEEG